MIIDREAGVIHQLDNASGGGDFLLCGLITGTSVFGNVVVRIQGEVVVAEGSSEMFVDYRVAH